MNMNNEQPAQSGVELAWIATIIKATQEAIARDISAEAHNAARGDDHKRATELRGIAMRVLAVDGESLVADLLQIPRKYVEKEAFDIAAKAAGFNTVAHANGRFMHPITQRVYGLWSDAVRWAQSAGADGAPAGQRDALYPQYVVPQRRKDDARPAESLNWTQGEA